MIFKFSQVNEHRDKYVKVHRIEAGTREEAEDIARARVEESLGELVASNKLWGKISYIMPDKEM